jgi:hypothetical protein
MNVQPDPAEAAMEACLTRLGFTAAAAEVVQQQGVTDAVQFKSISYQAMGQLTDSIIRAAAQTPQAGNAQARRQGTIVPYTALRNLKALRAWLDFRIVREEDLNVDLFIDAVKDRWLLRIDVLDDLQRHPPVPTFVPPKLENFSNWVVWEQQFLSYIRTFRSSSCGAPLTYLLRPVPVPTPETMAKDYEDIDEALVDTFSHTVSFSRANLIFLHYKLKDLLTGTNLYCHIQRFERSLDGRATFMAIKMQAEGPSERSRRIQIAYQKIRLTKYSSWSTRFNFDDYINVYQTAFNELQSLGEAQSETQKVTNFLEGITDRSFETIKTVIKSNNDAYMNFEVTQQRVKHLYEQNRDQEAGTRRVAAVSTTSKNKRKYTGPARGGGRQGGRGRGRGSGSSGRGGGAGRSPNTTPYGPNRLNHGIGHYDKDIWDKFTPEQKAKLIADREKAKTDASQGRPRQISCVSTQPSSILRPTTYPVTTIRPPTTDLTDVSVRPFLRESINTGILAVDDEIYRRGLQSFHTSSARWAGAASKADSTESRPILDDFLRWSYGMWVNSQRSRRPPITNTSPSILATTGTVITSPSVLSPLTSSTSVAARLEMEKDQEQPTPGPSLSINDTPAPATEVAAATWRIPRKVPPSKVSIDNFRAPAGAPDVGVISILADGSVVSTTDGIAPADAGATIEAVTLPTITLNAGSNPRSVRWKNSSVPTLIEPYIRKKKKKKKKPNHLKWKNNPFISSPGKPGTGDDSSFESVEDGEDEFEWKIIRTENEDGTIT